MRRKRRRTSCGYRLRKYLTDRMPAPHCRRFRVVNRQRFMIAQGVLVVIAVVALGLSTSVIVRSIRTARLNRSLAAMHTVEEGALPEVEVAAPLINGAGRGADSGLELSFMGLSDGSVIQSTAVSAVPSALHNTTGDVLPDMLKLLRTNGDTVGWLYIQGTVSLPVVYRDNEYYLTHDFNGHHNTSGTLFLDESHPLTANAQNLLIHGHSMYDGSMFGLLTHYKKLDFVKTHPIISFSTLREKETYAVFAVLKVSSDPRDAEYFDYMSHPVFATDEAFDAYIMDVLARSIYEIPVDVASGDALLTLSTCLDDDRLVVLARKKRLDETKDELISAVELSYAT